MIPTITLEEFKNLIIDQGLPIEKAKFECPMCGTHQCGQDFIEAGAGTNFEEIEKFLAFSCIGRFNDKGSPPKTDEKAEDYGGCNWTLGGFLTLQNLNVKTPDGKIHPRFRPINFTDPCAASSPPAAGAAVNPTGER